jgi:branched-chain amino acid transport system ATP-binding protein
MNENDSAYILQTQSLSKSFKGFLAVNDVNLKVREGTIHALIGPNGAGKTTCFNLLTKFLAPSDGKIFLKGKDITKLSPTEIAGYGVIRSFQISAVFPHMSVLENVRIALQKKLGTEYQFWKSPSSLNVLNDEAMEYLHIVGLQDFANEEVVHLPYGRKRLLEIATTLAMQPMVMLLDEPTQGMGHEDVDRVTGLIEKVAKGRTVLMVEHNMKVVASIAHTISVLQRGSILAEGTYAEVSSNPQVIEAYMGTAGHLNE